jgi:hypothetical protein
MDVPGDRVKLGVLKVKNTTPSFSVDKNSGTWYDHKALRKGTNLNNWIAEGSFSNN